MGWVYPVGFVFKSVCCFAFGFGVCFNVVSVSGFVLFCIYFYRCCVVCFVWFYSCVLFWFNSVVILFGLDSRLFVCYLLLIYMFLYLLCWVWFVLCYGVCRFIGVAYTCSVWYLLLLGFVFCFDGLFVLRLAWAT